MPKRAKRKSQGVNANRATAPGEALAVAVQPSADVERQAASDRLQEQKRLIALVRALYKGSDPSKRLEGPGRSEAEAALQQLAVLKEDMHELPEFEAYIASLPWNFEGLIDRLSRLHLACRSEARPEWLRGLRGAALRLRSYEEDMPEEEELTHEQRELLDACGDPLLHIEESLAGARTDGRQDETGGLLVRILEADLKLQRCGPWNYMEGSEAIRSLPCPALEDLRAAHRENPYIGHRSMLSPRGWALLWELEHVTSNGVAEVLARCPGGTGNDLCDGLLMVGLSLTADQERSEELLRSSIDYLMDYLTGDIDFFGESIVVQTSAGARDIFVGLSSVRLGSPTLLLTRLAECAPSTYQRKSELNCLVRVFAATRDRICYYDEPAIESEIEGLEWCCSASVAFRFAAAASVEDLADRIRLLVESIAISEESGVPLAATRFWGVLTGEAMTADEAAQVVEALERLVTVKDWSTSGRKLWISVIGSVFKAVSVVPEVREDVLHLARAFREHLEEAKELFLLGYLEQVVGSKESALRAYLVQPDTAKVMSDSAVSNIRILLRGSQRLAEAEGAIEILREATTWHSEIAVIQGLLKDAEARRSDLAREEQFEKTALTRWPQLTAPARKLLAVFGNIKEYKDFHELGRYAGLEAHWAQRHYDKLVESGMLLVGTKGFRINPYIAPLLERENQHGVVGQIVRSTGTSAVKQVFNSGREFSIYKVMVQLCPNHLVFPNSALQSFMSFDRMKELVSSEEFGYYLRASVDILVVSSTTYLPMLAIEVDSVWHDTEKQLERDVKKDSLFAAAGVPFMRLRPVGSPSENTVRAEVAEHLDQLVRTLRVDLPGFEQAKVLLQDLAGTGAPNTGLSGR